MDLTSDVGFCNAMQMVCALKPGTGCLAAPVCGSWIFMTGLGKKVPFDKRNNVAFDAKIGTINRVSQCNQIWKPWQEPRLYVPKPVAANGGHQPCFSAVGEPSDCKDSGLNVALCSKGRVVHH